LHRLEAVGDARGLCRVVSIERIGQHPEQYERAGDERDQRYGVAAGAGVGMAMAVRGGAQVGRIGLPGEVDVVLARTRRSQVLAPRAMICPAFWANSHTGCGDVQVLSGFEKGVIARRLRVAARHAIWIDDDKPICGERSHNQRR
jgi:hypothetical protein